MNTRTYRNRPNHCLPARRVRGEFRLIPAFSIEHNAARLKRHVERLRKRQRCTPVGRRFAAIVCRRQRGQV